MCSFRVPNGVKSIQTAGYNGARTVNGILTDFRYVNLYIGIRVFYNIWFNSYQHTVASLSNRMPSHSGRSYYIDILLIKMAVLAMFQENWSQFKIPSTN